MTQALPSRYPGITQATDGTVADACTLYASAVTSDMQNVLQCIDVYV